MNKRLKTISAVVLLVLGTPFEGMAQKLWTLQDCIDYALGNSLSIEKNRINETSAFADLKQARAGLLPTVSGNISQGLTYLPFQETGGNTTQSGSYGINLSWTFWNGGANTRTVKYRELAQQQAAYQTEQLANNLQEQIAQLYVQILYTKEALSVNEELLKNDESQYERAVVLQQQGQLSQSDVAQLAAQLSNGRYNVVNARTTIDSYKLQLKLLVELTDAEAFDIAPLVVSDEQLVGAVPAQIDIYAAALEHRPEIRQAVTDVKASILNIGIAKAAYLPSISLTAGLGDNHLTGLGKNYFDQMKQNLNGTMGLSVSFPLIDGRRNKTNVERAKLAYLTSQLSLLDTQKTLLNKIETYRLNAVSSQEKYKAAQANVASMATNYQLLDEQFRLGLKNIVELQTGRNQLLGARQEALQSKYTALLNLQLLRFYAGEPITL